jgi:segregation and condensation protein B
MPFSNQFTRRRGIELRRSYSERPHNCPQHSPFQLIEPSLVRSDDPHTRTKLLSQLEALLFVSDEPLHPNALKQLMGVPNVEIIHEAIHSLRTLLNTENSSFEIAEVGNGYLLLTRSHYHPWLVRLRRTGHELRISPSAMETLSVIAYKQPITRADLEAIRGVNCSELLRVLMEAGLIRVTGREQTLGRPQLYATTKKFLRVFGLNSTTELPAV